MSTFIKILIGYIILSILIGGIMYFFNTGNPIVVACETILAHGE